MMKPIVVVAAVLAMLAASPPAARAESAEAKAAAASLQPYRSLPEFVQAGSPFDARSCMRGKSILGIPVSSANPFTQNIYEAMSQIAKTLGFTFREWDNQGQPSQWVQGMDYAVNNKFNLIDLLGGTDPRVLKPQVENATAHGIKVIASHWSGFEQKIPSYVTGAVPIHYFKAGELLADWAIWKTDAKVNALVIVSREVYSTGAMIDGLKKVFAEDCPHCKFRIINAPVPDWSTKIQLTVRSALLADPTINYVIPIYDSMSQFVVPAITITGKSNAVKIATFNGTPFVLGLVQQGKVEMDIGEDLDWVGHGIMGSEMRRLCGLPVPKDAHIPFYIFDASNAATAGNPPQLSTGYGDAYKAGYSKEWKLTR
ncbi:MAG: sugar ABC transporter substrate-binding protein [Acetobacteraceae bacterium]